MAPPLGPGDSLPVIELLTADRRVAELRPSGGGPLVFTLVRPFADERAELARQLVERLQQARRTLRPDVARRTDFWILLIDDPGDGSLPGWLPVGRDWEIALGPEAEIRELAGRLGVLIWDGDEGLPGQTFATVVVDAAGRIDSQLIGIDGWTVRDLVGTIVTVD